MLNKIIGFFGAAALALVLVTSVDAAVLKNAYLTLGNSTFGTSGVNHSFTFYHPSASINSVQFRYCTTASGTCTDTDMDVTSGAEGTTTRAAADVSGNWDPDFSTNHRIRTTRNGGGGTGQAVFVFGFTNITNPTSGAACTASSNSSTETCYVRINTYSDTNYTTAADSAVVSMTLTTAVTVSATVDPSFSLIISGVDETTTTTVNGTTLTTGIDPLVTALPFSNLQPATPKYIAHALRVTTNATNGYSVTVAMAGNMTGTAYGDDIDPFANGADHDTPASWASPTGTASGTDTGWLGVGTDDTDVPSHTSNTFYSLGTTPATVARQTTSASNELDLVVYGIEVNAFQEADSYTGTMTYNALPVY